MTELIEKLSADVGKKLIASKLKLVTAESCTAGGLAFAITQISGSSAWFERGFVVYSNSSKAQMLGVKPLTLEVFGAVSEQTVIEMAEGALKQSEADIALAITGIAGPTGGTPDKPVGTVWFAVARKDFPTETCVDIFSGSRKDVREKSIQFALQKLTEL